MILKVNELLLNIKIYLLNINKYIFLINKRKQEKLTTRGNVHWIVTEYGIVHLFGKSLKQRAKGLIGIAHPDHREMLEISFYQRFRHALYLQ